MPKSPFWGLMGQVSDPIPCVQQKNVVRAMFFGKNNRFCSAGNEGLPESPIPGQPRADTSLPGEQGGGCGERLSPPRLVLAISGKD